ncbi:MAG: hypothetical protein EB121_01880 [Alphaproteobacteria bacterium]|nr:hypothetical protein [Alphaproteobacteria bacterium]
MRAHVIKNGIVVNTIEVDSLDFLPNLIDGETQGAIGDRYENGLFIKPEPVVEIPFSVTMRQGRLALLQAGLLSQVQSAISAQGEAAVIEWEYAQTIDRASPLVARLAASLGLDESQLDALFISAASL